MMASLSGGLASMGAGVPYAIAAKFAHPDRPVIALVGDGAMQMNGMNELITVAKYWKQWSSPHFIVMVMNNRDLNQVTWEDARAGGRSEIRGDAEHPGRLLRALRRADRAEGYSSATILTRSPAPGTRRWRRIGRWCLSSTATRTCRRCRRTSP